MKLNKINQLAFVALLGIMSSCNTNTEWKPVNILSMPVQVEQSAGSVTIDEQSRIVLNSLPIEHLGVITQELVLKHTGLNLEIEKNQSANSGKHISLCLNEKPQQDSEGYVLDIDQHGVKITASSQKGLFYGLQSLRQLLPLGKTDLVQLPYVHIDDYPRFGWRGLHLDVSRHFFTVDEVKRFIDLMSMYKFNTFHWHLTDDQGWRIEIKKYPLLTEKGGWRERIGFEENQKKG